MTTTSPLPTRDALVGRLAVAWDWTAERVAGIDSADLERSTPCEAFDLAGLLDHLAGSVERFVVTLGGTPLPGASSPPARFEQLQRANLAVWERADLGGAYELPLGVLPAPLVADINLAEVVLHAWDISRSTGEVADVPEALAAQVLAIGHGLLGEGDEARHGAFAPAVSVPADASASDRMAAFYGRRP